MTEHPIIFSGPMVRAILEGRKTMTRRVIKPQPTLTRNCGFEWKGEVYGQGSDDVGTNRNFCRWACPYDQQDARLWVRETFQTLEDFAIKGACYYRADGETVTALIEGSEYDLSHKWHPSIFMPRRASRILLEVTAVRVERLWDISEDDAKAEGAPWEDCWMSYRQSFESLWGFLNANRGYGWDANPWVWVIEFRRIQTEALHD